MASKYQVITGVYNSTIDRVTQTPANWTAFLRSACRNYKCRFDEQILIYAQRPDATAVLEIEKWNRQFGRWVNKGATGIAVFDDEHNGNHRLKHYFDISDTHDSRFSRAVPVWQMEQRYEADVIESLENSFGELDDKSTLAEALISAAKNAVEDNMPDYLRDLMYSREDSFLEELDELNVEVEYGNALKNSVAYMLLTRCGINADEYFEFEDFRHLIDFNTPQTVNALGIAASDIAESCLREISATVINLLRTEKQQNRTFAKPETPAHNVPIRQIEGSAEHDRSIDIPHGGRLPPAESGATGGTVRNPWQIRITPKEIPEAASQNPVRESADNVQAERASDGDRADSQRAHGAIDRADGGGTGRDGADESRESNAVGRDDEQHPALSGGNDTPRPDIQLKPLPTITEQLSILGEAEEEKSSAFSISQQIIDEVLTSGGNELDSTLRIAAYFKKDHSTAENAAFLQKEYRRFGSSTGKGFVFGGNHVSVWFEESGIRIAYGDTVLTADASLVTWEQAAARTRELLDMGRYMPQSELDKVDGYEIKAIADHIWYTHQDLADGYEFSFMDAEIFKGGAPNSMAQIAELLADTEQRRAIFDGLMEFAAEFSENNRLLRFRYSVDHLMAAANGLADLEREPLVFTADESVSSARPSFITQDEIDRVLIGSGEPQNTRKLDTYAYFLQSHTIQEKASFLSHSYGIGGGSRTGFDEWHDGKGISYSRENNHMPYDKVVLPWPKVARRIDELIADGRYMSQRELDYIPEYEMNTLARSIVSFYPYQPEDLPRPFPHGTDYQDSVKIVRSQLDEPARVAEILSQMAEILDNTADFDRNYERMQKAFRDLTAYQNGTYTLFAPTNKPTEQTQPRPARPATPKQPPAPQASANPEAVYDLSLGATVYLGIEEFEIYSFDDALVVLRDMSMPLFTQEMPRAEFDRKLRENRLNDGLIKAAAPVTVAEKILNEDGTDYYIFYLPEASESAAALSHDTLNLITEKAERYVICAEVCYLSEEEQSQFNIEFRKMPRDYSLLPESARERIATIKPDYAAEIPAPEPKTPTADTTPPVYAEYLKIKAENPGSMVMYQLGDFFEFYGEDAEIAARVLDIALISRDIRGQSERIPMCGIPSHRQDEYLKKLIDSGYTVVVATLPDGERTRSVSRVEQSDGESAHAPELYTPKRGDRYEIQGRFFIVDTVDTDWQTVSLRDVTFENSKGFPIFRSESLEFIRMYEPIRPEPQPDQPTTSVYEVDEGNGLRSIVIDFNARQPEPVPEPDAIIPSWEKPKPRARTQSFDAFPGIPTSERNNFVITDDNLGAGGAKTKYRNNVEAIRTLQTIEAEQRLATPEEQEILSRYVGWGGLADAFDKDKSAWTNEYVELQSLLTPEEYKSARASTVNAHYTSPTVIKAIYKAVENMGFKTGNVLEPSCGIGNFFGLVPESMSGSKLFGVELDSLTGRIAQQLYQKNSIAIQGYESTNLPDSFFDLAIGNVPFGDYGVIDKKYDKHKFSIHDYFFAKTLDKVRPGGVVAFVTSRFMMDAKNPAVRKYIAQRADLLGAIRLPNTAFQANAGTEVTTDIIFLQKRDRIIDIEPEWVHLGQTENEIPVNSYFAEHPDMILGTMSNDSGIRMYGAMNSASCIPFPDSDLSEQLADAITNIHAEIPEYERGEDEPEEDKSVPADPNVRNFSYTLVHGQIYYRQDSRMMPVELPVTTQSRVKGMIKLRECVRDLIMYQTEGYPDSDIQAEQAKLNRLYDDFTNKYGLINSRGNSIAFSQDSAYCLLCSLEVIDENGELERKADMFQKRTIRPHEPVTHVDTASEALSVSMSEKAHVDLPYMSQLTGMSEETLAKELQGVIFLNPMHGYGGSKEEKYLTADEYLSGNVREKLEWAKRSAEQYPEDYAVNVTALEAAQPKDLTAAEISVRLGATWLPEDVIQQFMYELLNTQWRAREKIKVHYSGHTGEWNVTEKSADRSNIHSFNTYGTQRINAYKIIEETLNLRDVRVFDTVYDTNGDKKRVLNKRETAIAQAKQEIIRTKFEEWIWKNPDRRERLCRMYNDKFNCIRPREYDGSHIKFVGMNPEIKLRKHQIDAIAHILYGGNTLLAHEVGAGKTFEMVAAAMESKRLGLCTKSLIVVPNHITEQWAAEFLQLYPSANILVATKKDFETKNRKKFCARIATGDYDAVIIGHSQFEKIPMSAERQQAMLERQIDELVDGIDEVKRNNGERYTVKQMEKAKKNLEVKLSKLNDQSRKDDVVTFEELGIDRLFVDEAHYYKNLYLITKMRNVAGIAQTEAQKSSDLFMKTQYLDELTGGRGTVFATGTPISNSMVELYTMQRYLQYKLLVRNDLQHFDAWASTFGEQVTAIELAPEGTGYRAKTRFAKFFNLPELMSMFRMTADIQTADMLNLPVPKANFHNEVIKPSDWQKDMVGELADRAEKIRNRDVPPNIDNMLCVTNDGRKLALDQRIINPLLPDDPDGKVSTCVNNVFRIWEDTKENRSAQLIFSDLSTPKTAVETVEVDGVPEAAAFQNVYDDIRKKLIAKGVPAEEIAFIHDADTEAKKKELFAKVRKGQVRVVLGSTQKMGAGTNMQDRLIALHDLDCPWRPADLAQRLGRIVRQGNKNPEVEVFRYVTESTFDSYLFQLVENKQKFISQIMTSKTPVRSAEDVDEKALSYAEIKALATGNPHIIEKCQLEMDVGRLKILHASHLSQKYSLEDKILKEYPQEIKRITERIAGYQTDIETVAKHPANKDYFPPMKVSGILYAEKKDAGTAIIETCKAMTSPDPVLMGEYRGFQMVLSFDSMSKEYRVTLQGALTHTVKLSTDIHGNITRLDNALDGFAESLKGCESQLAGVQTQFEAARGEVDRPFPQQQEYEDKSARLKELNILLNMDEKEEVLFDDAPDEGEDEPVKKPANRER